MKDAEPHANDDRFGARAGRTQIVHPLDNDTDSISSILMISAVRGVPEGYRVDITPDLASSTCAQGDHARRRQGLSFRYVAGNGDHEDDATVTVDIKRPEDNDKPHLRDGASSPDYSCPAPWMHALLGDWRDPEHQVLRMPPCRRGGGAHHTGRTPGVHPRRESSPARRS